MVDDTFCGKFAANANTTTTGLSSGNQTVQITHENNIPASMSLKKLVRAPEYPVGELPAGEEALATSHPPITL